jgi:hypothetical protein
VSIDYSGISFVGSEEDLRLYHYESGAWVDATVLPVDTVNKTICAIVSSLSPFAIFEPENQPPDCSGAYAGPDCLWPANHKMVSVSLLGVTDPDGDAVSIVITGITSDEATASDKGAGGAKHAADADGVGTDTAQLRAERSENGNGRVYEIGFIASDGKGAESEGSVQVRVPHDQSAPCEAIDDGQNYDATAIN